jgi:hypothetical protein
LIFQDLDLGEALSAEAKLRPTEGGGKHPPEAKSFGKSSAEDLKRREMPSPPRDQLRVETRISPQAPAMEEEIDRGADHPQTVPHRRAKADG